jgi:hypothetical protein
MSSSKGPKQVDPALVARATPELRADVQAKAVDGRLACATLRKLAEDHGVAYKVAGAAADDMGYKVRDCDLGCF